MNQKSNKLTVPDLISVGVFTALYFVLVTVATFACALLPGVGNILLPAVAALISGSVYMLLAAKLQKFGGITIMGLVMGLFFFVSGHFVLSFAANIVCGVAADLVAAAGKYRSKKLLLASYVVFSYGLTGPILPLWFMKSAYIANLTARGKDAAYIDTLFAPINSGSFVVSILAILICALVGGFFGQKMLKRRLAVVYFPGMAMRASSSSSGMTGLRLTTSGPRSPSGASRGYARDRGRRPAPP